LSSRLLLLIGFLNELRDLGVGADRRRFTSTFCTCLVVGSCLLRM
jgi:hypothetical protein